MIIRIKETPFIIQLQTRKATRENRWEEKQKERRGLHDSYSRVNVILVNGNEDSRRVEQRRAKASSDPMKCKMLCCSDTSSSVYYYCYFFCPTLFLLNRHRGSLPALVQEPWKSG